MRKEFDAGVSPGPELGALGEGTPGAGAPWPHLTLAFSSSETIMFLHQIFYQGLKARISSWPTLVLGESQPSCPPPPRLGAPHPSTGEQSGP